MRLSRYIPSKPPYRVSIRAQLTALVSIVAIISLVILAITTGVYFTSNYKNLRSDRLYIAAQLKSSQIDQTLSYLYYQCYWVSTRDTLQTGLANYVAGNKTKENWVDTQSVVDKFLGSSNLFSLARVYDVSFNNVLNATNNGTGNLVPDSIIDQLLPLSGNDSLPSSLETIGMVTDPVKNDTNYLMSMSLPILANPSIILSDSKVYGYITVIMSADGLLNVFNDTTSLAKSNVAIVSGVYFNDSTLDDYKFVFPPYGAPETILDYAFPIQNGSFLNSALRQGRGGSIKSTSFFYHSKVAIGYFPCSSAYINWVAIVTQAESVFLSPSTRLAKIIAGTVVGIGVFAMVITFPLAYWAVKPIVRLQKATEVITEGRGLRPTTPGSMSRSNSIKRDWSSIHSLMLHTPNTNNTSTSSNTPTVTDARARTIPNHHTQHSNSNNTIDEKMASQPILSDHDSAHPSTHSNTKYIAEATPPPECQSLSLSNDERAERISANSRNYTTSTNLIEARVPSYRRLFLDELSDLTETFNTMTDALDQHYALLEEKVHARTKQLEAAKIEAETANEAKTVFIANISHELRTPLNGILGMTAISMEEDDINKIRNSLKLIFRSGELLLHILTELLTFSKNVLKRTKLEKRNFCITDVALQIKSIFGKVAKDQRVKLSISLSPNDIRTKVLYGDSNRIIQIVMNLVSNALKFTPVDGKVDVRMYILGEYDEVLSEKFDHKKVYIKEGTETEEYKVMSASKRSNSKTNTIKNNSSKNSSFYDISSSDGKDGQTSESDDDDDTYHRDTTGEVTSIMSSSTSSYDDAIFNNQFKKNTDLYDESEEGLGEILKEAKTWVIGIEVEDSGPGISPELQESVFEPFVQGDQTLSRQYGGTGLGLSICRQLATMMKGTMTLESHTNVGSKFTFTVPLTQTREINVDNIEFPYEDEFNPKSKKNRKVKFKMARSLNSRKSRSSIITAGASSHNSFSHIHIQNTLDENSDDNMDNNGDTINRNSINNNSNSDIYTTANNSTSTFSNNRSPDKSLSESISRMNDRYSIEGAKSNVSLDRPFLQSTGTATSTKSIPRVSKTDVRNGATISETIANTRATNDKSPEATSEKKEDTIHILVAEDNHVNQEVIKRMLQLVGIKNIDLACDGQDAFDKVKALSEKEEHYDIIFMDVQMPKVDGLLSTKMIRNDLKYDYPIVALTAFADDSNIKECLEAGMNGFLSKPIKRPKLKTIIDEFTSDKMKDTDPHKGK